VYNPAQAVKLYRPACINGVTGGPLIAIGLPISRPGMPVGRDHSPAELRFLLSFLPLNRRSRNANAPGLAMSGAPKK
jgi:hypothetical protein